MIPYEAPMPSQEVHYHVYSKNGAGWDRETSRLVSWFAAVQMVAGIPRVLTPRIRREG